MKVEFFFPGDPITGYGTNNNTELIELNKTIKEKVHKKVVEIPCIPTKEMKVDIASFVEVFGFSEEEMEWIEDYYITSVFVKPTHLEVWLEYTALS